jgi:hypothetical protein
MYLCSVHCAGLLDVQNILSANWKPFIRWSPDQRVSQFYAECPRSFCCALVCVFMTRVSKCPISLRSEHPISTYLRGIYLWLYSPLLDIVRFFSLLIFYTVGKTPWMGISPSQCRYLHTWQHKHRIDAQRHPWQKWDLTSRSQSFSERRLSMP